MVGQEQESVHEHSAGPSLIFRAKELVCALPLATVEEIMRPLPVRPLEGAPPFVTGISVVRGAPVPVVDAGTLLSGEASSPRRLIALKVVNRRAALAVDDVLGLRTLPPETLSTLPPLLRDGRSDAIELIGTLDADFLLVLRSGRLVPDSVWTRIERQEAPQ